MNDLWKFSIPTGRWTWIGGSSSPDAYGAYGTKGVPHSANMPGARAEGVAWFESISKEAWIFGGAGRTSNESGTSTEGLVAKSDLVRSSGNMNDLWRYSIPIGMWTWMSGSNTTTGVNGAYGTINLPSGTNSPGSRYGAVSWFDKTDRRLWLYGGSGHSSSGGRTSQRKTAHSGVPSYH